MDMNEDAKPSDLYPVTTPTRFLGHVDQVAGYEWVVVADSEEAALEALRDEYARAVADGRVLDVVPADCREDPIVQYFGAAVVPMVTGKVEWI